MQLGVTQEFLLTSTTLQVPNVYNLTSGSAPRVTVDVTGTITRSTAVTAAMGSGGDLPALDARTGLSLWSPTLEAIDLDLLLDYILDRIDALEVHHP
jgi:hypothetical protein